MSCWVFFHSVNPWFNSSKNIFLPLFFLLGISYRLKMERKVIKFVLLAALAECPSFAEISRQWQNRVIGWRGSDGGVKIPLLQRSFSYCIICCWPRKITQGPCLWPLGVDQVLFGTWKFMAKCHPPRAKRSLGWDSSTQETI